MPEKASSNLRYLELSRAQDFLTCPRCFATPKSSLKYKNKNFYCKICKQKYPVKGKIIDLINPHIMSKQVMNELQGNEIPLTKKNIEHYAKKDKWSSYYNHSVNIKISSLLKELKKVPADGLISLGSGPGFEIKQILKRRRYKLFLSSDLAPSMTSIVPHTLAGYDIELCLFTSDLNYTPVLPGVTLPILIYEALHHTKNSVKTVERMMKKGYGDIFFVEPCTNFLIKILAKMGLAQRIEYSGVKPDFLDLSKIKRIAKKLKYEVTIKTLWEVPEEYVRYVAKKGSISEKLIVGLIDLASTVGNNFGFGSFAVAHLHKK